MTISEELTQTTKAQYSDTIKCYALIGMGFVGNFETKTTAKKVAKEWAFALKATSNKIEETAQAFKVTTLYNG